MYNPSLTEREHKRIFRIYIRFMKHNNILKKRIKPTFISLISHVSSIFHTNDNKTFEDILGSNLSKSIKPIIWFHIDSITGFEIIHPIIKRFTQDGKHSILMTVSSNLYDKYSLKLEQEYIDYICKLPADNDLNAKLFLLLTKPVVAIFSSPTYCSCYISNLKKRNIPTFLITEKIALPFLKGNKSLYQNSLKIFTHIFVFDNTSKAYLNNLRILNVTVDEYIPIENILSTNKTNYYNPIIDKFVANDKLIFIGGNIDSDKDLKLVTHLANSNPLLKCIFIPHTISEERLNTIKYNLKGYALFYSECKKDTDFSNTQVLIIDFIGDLSNIYNYGTYAYIGGASHSYLYNIIEATANGLPTSFGPQNKHKAVSKHLINTGVSQIVKNSNDIYNWEKRLQADSTLILKIKHDSIQFVNRSIETTNRIYSFITGLL